MERKSGGGHAVAGRCWTSDASVAAVEVESDSRQLGQRLYGGGVVSGIVVGRAAGEGRYAVVVVTRGLGQADPKLEEAEVKRDGRGGIPEEKDLLGGSYRAAGGVVWERC